MTLEKLAVVGIVGYVLYKVWENRQAGGSLFPPARSSCNLQSDQVLIDPTTGLPVPGQGVDVTPNPLPTFTVSANLPIMNPAYAQQSGQPYVVSGRVFSMPPVQ